MANNWHIPKLSTIEEKFKTDLSEGLTSREARSRLAEKNKNCKPSSLFLENGASPFKVALSFIISPLALILIIVALLATVLGRQFLGLSVLAVCASSLLVGGIILGRASKRIESMREFASPVVRVRRGGNLYYTDGRNLVRGDVILLCEGDLLTCDARLVSSDGLVVEELYNSDNKVQRRRVLKNAQAEYDRENAPAIPNADNMVYAGSAVVSGEALCVVCDTDRDVYLADFVSEGALGGKDAESELVKNFRPVFHRITFISVALLLILSLISLLTFNGKGSESFLYVFLMLLSAVFLLTDSLLSCGAKVIISSYIKRLSVHKSAQRGKDNSATVRNVKTLDVLTEVTDLFLVGKAGLCCGEFNISAVYTSQAQSDRLTCEIKGGERLLKYIYTYVKAQKEGSLDNEFRSNGYSDALFTHIRTCGYDVNAASIAIKSLYFASDVRSGRYYACAETESEVYRTAIVTDVSVLNKCKFIYDETARQIEKSDIEKISEFCSVAERKGDICLFVISEEDFGTVFEGVVVLEQKFDAEINAVMPELSKLNVKTTVLLFEEDQNSARLCSDPKLSRLFDRKIAYASEFRRSGDNILDGFGTFCAYVGFTDEEYRSLINYTRSKGSKTAAFGVCNDYNSVMACADVVISCDTLNYSSERHREALYEKLPPEGKDNSIRASQCTRLLAKVLVKRAHSNGGGLYSVMRAIKVSRCTYVSLAQFILLFALLMSPLLTFSIMSVFTGTVFLDPLMTAALAAVFALLSVSVFAKSEQKSIILAEKCDFTKYPYELLRSRFIPIVSRAGVALIVSIVVSILGAVGVFGENPVFTLPIFICLLLTLFVEVFIINTEFTKKGEGRRNCWLKVLISYGLLLGVCSLSTQSPFASEFFKNGWGSWEYFIILGYSVLYAIALFCPKLIEFIRNKRGI